MQTPARKVTIQSLLAIVFLLMLCSTIFFYIKYQEAQDVLSATSGSNAQEVAEVVRKVSRHIVLPENEQPTLATVSEVDKLRVQNFFLKAENGDKVLIYPQARKAYLYRPRTDKLIEVSPIAVGDESATTPQNSQATQLPTTQPQVTPPPTSSLSPTPNQPQTIKIEIRNATINQGIANIARTNITSQISNIEVTRVGNANNQNLSRTTLVVMNTSKQSDLQRIAQQINAEFQSENIQGEEGSSADAIIYLGTDYSEG